MTKRACVFRPAPADAADRIAWPAAFGTRFTVFVDVEEEFDWSASLDRAQRSTKAMAALPGAHRRFRDDGVALGCLVDYPVAVDPWCIDILHSVIADGRSEIGTQLHPWVNPPHTETLNAANSFVGNLPRALAAAKLDRLTDAITGAFGAPRVYRAGRYGFGPDTPALLRTRGYRIDSSMRAGYDYSAEGGPDFTRIGPHAFRIGELIELPLTTVHTGYARRGGATLYRSLGVVPRLRGLAARTGLLSRVALTPEDMPIADALRAVDRALDDGVRVLNFSFHSPSLAVGHTPYVRDAGDLAKFWRWWDVMLAHLARAGVANAGVGELLVAAI